jgi:hypothetical protein
MHDKLKEKLGVGFKRFKILGACNTPYGLTYKKVVKIRARIIQTGILVESVYHLL